MKAYAATDVGVVRSVNQDMVFANTQKTGSLPNLFIVADGMGGENAGDLASRLAVDSIVNYVANHETVGITKLISDSIKYANEVVYKKSLESKAYDGMGTTCVVACISNNMLFVANVGDSRLYLISEEGIEQVTRDHSYVEEMVDKGEIKREEARTHEKKNWITRAVGAEGKVLVDSFDVRLDKAVKILMCTDGLTNMVEDEIINTVITEGKEISVIVNELIEKAKENGGRDNIGIVLIEP